VGAMAGLRPKTPGGTAPSGHTHEFNEKFESEGVSTPALRVVASRTPCALQPSCGAARSTTCRRRATGCTESYGGLHERLWGVSSSSFAWVRSTCFRPTIGYQGVVMNDMGKPWARADLFFLKDSLERGMSLAEIAGFLRRTADEVREKAKRLEQVSQPRPRRGPRPR
jgi:hypothetical protein